MSLTFSYSAKHVYVIKGDYHMDVGCELCETMDDALDKYFEMINNPQHKTTFLFVVIEWDEWHQDYMKKKKDLLRRERLFKRSSTNSIRSINSETVQSMINYRAPGRPKGSKNKA